MERYALKPDPDKVRIEKIERNTRLVMAALESHRHLPAALASALVELSVIMFEEAAWWEASSRAGKKSTSAALRDAAGRIQLIGESLLSDGVDEKFNGWHVALPVDSGASPDPFGFQAARLAERYPLINQSSGTSIDTQLAPHMLSPGLREKLAGLQPTTIEFSGTYDENFEDENFEKTIEVMGMFRIGPPAPADENEEIKPDPKDGVPSAVNAPIVDKAIAGVAPVPGQASGIPVVPFDRLFLPVDQSKRPDHRSVSQVTAYENCPLSERLRRYEDAPRVPSWAMVGGTAFHKIVGQFEAEVWANVEGETAPLFLGQVVDAWLEHLEKTWEAILGEVVGEYMAARPGIDMRSWHTADGGRENYSWWQVEGAEMFKRYLAQRGEWGKTWKLATINGAPAIEIEFLHIVGSVPLKGFIDLVWEHRQHETLLIDDLKSGRNRPDDELQLINYSDALASMLRNRAHPLGPNGGIRACYYHARKGERTEHRNYLNASSIAELGYRVKTADASERMGHYPPRRSSMCISCDVHASCPIGKL